MKNQIIIARFIFLLVAVIAGVYASNITESSLVSNMYVEGSGGYTAKPDSVADGAAAGFAIMSGLSLVALALTFLRKD